MVALRYLIILLAPLAQVHKKFHFQGLGNQHRRRCSPISDNRTTDPQSH